MIPANHVVVGLYCIVGRVLEGLCFQCGCELLYVEGARNEQELCLKERGEDRYCWRAGVMSRNE